MERINIDDFRKGSMLEMTSEQIPMNRTTSVNGKHKWNRLQLFAYIFAAFVLGFCLVTSLLLWKNGGEFFGSGKMMNSVIQPYSSSSGGKNDSERIDDLERKVAMMNQTISQLLNQTFVSKESNDVLGSVDDLLVTTDGLILRGWACNIGISRSIPVEIYVGGLQGNDTVFVRQAFADYVSEAAISSKCQSVNSAHRFYVLFEYGELAAHVNKSIYVYGISQNQNSFSSLLQNSGKVIIPSAAIGPTPMIRGNLDDVIPVVNGFAIRGYACYRNLNQSINVNLYLGGAPGKGSFISALITNAPNEADISSYICGTSGVPHRFYLFFTKEQAANFVGRGIFVSGNSTGQELLLNGSGKLRIPSILSTGDLRGEITSYQKNGQGDHIIRGYACDFQKSISISVQLYAGTPLTSYGVMLAQATASAASTPEVALNCGTQIGHVYSIQLSNSTLLPYIGRGIFVYGMTSVPGQPKELLLNSGLFRFN
jgi:hypothetical protein